MIAIHARWRRQAKRLNRQGQVRPSPDEPRSAASRTPSHEQTRPLSSPASSRLRGILSLRPCTKWAWIRVGIDALSWINPRCAFLSTRRQSRRADGHPPLPNVERSVCREIEADGEGLNEAHRRDQGAQRRLGHVLDLEHNRRAFDDRAQQTVGNRDRRNPPRHKLGK